MIETGTYLLEQLLELLTVVGLPLLFAIFFLKGAIVGKPLPTSVFLPGYVVAIQASYRLAIRITIVVTVGFILGQFVIYAGSRRYGLPFAQWLPYFDFEPGSDHTERFESWLASYGGLSIFVTNIVPWTRGLVAVPAGLGRYPAGRFAIHTTASTVLYHSGYVLLAFLGVEVVSVTV